MPKIMSWLGTIIGFPFDGLKILLVDIIKTLASNWASKLKGICTAIWSPSKSALNAAQVNGCSSIAFPSINFGSKAWTPNLWSVGALFKRTGCSLTINSRASQTALVSFSTNFLACLIVDASPSLFMEFNKTINFKNFYKIVSDNRDLNYDKYFSKGLRKSMSDDYTSENTKRLSLSDTIKLIRPVLKKEKIL